MNNRIVWFILRIAFKATFTERKITFINLPETRASLLVTRALFILLVDAIFPFIAYAISLNIMEMKNTFYCFIVWQTDTKEARVSPEEKHRQLKAARRLASKEMILN